MATVQLYTRKLKRLDKRFRSYDRFKYLIEFNGLRRQLGLIELRNWCWKTFGPGVEISSMDHWWSQLDDSEKDYYGLGNNWAWKDEEYSNRIYIKGEEELLMLRLSGFIT